MRKVFSYHSAIEYSQRDQAMKEFMHIQNPALEGLELTFQQKNNLPKVLICTDRASRGLDFGRAEVIDLLYFVSINRLCD